ncbi:IgGFc-binding protein [Nannocystis sp. SCPEA4]|uniref:IgGFc-binding protein n=1 Tax=Nannocystis sp. SCPEA4 TaxID=2996787 RepID=UPI00226F5798|nr:IgGFc-binding protein [Nannocystis sp. SCPEA4]MCY1061579.1 IgGFc-binding protein [Nannocystis sp. SCPEA4]
MRTTVGLLLGACAAIPLACGDDNGRGTDTMVATQTTQQPVTSVDTTDPPPTSAATDTTDATAGSMSATDSGTTTDGPSEPTTGTTSESSTTAVSATLDTTTGETSESTMGPTCANPVCSRNLDAVECDGMVVESCSPGTYCVDAMCTPLTPCEAAELLEGSQGCRYWAVKTELLNEGDGACFAAFIANTWNTPVKIQVEYNGAALPVAQFARIPSGQGANITYQPYDENVGLPVGEVALLFLSRNPAGNLVDCPAPAGVAAETQVIGNGFGKGFLITTDVPVSAYQMQPYGGGAAALTAATLLLPTSVWDVNYIGANAYAQGQAGQPLLAIIADQDGTQVTIDPKAAIQGGNGVQGGPAGVPIVYNLNRGQTMQIAQTAEITGSPIASNKPIGVFGGASCMNVPTNALYCEGAHQQLPPIKALGSEYVAVRYRNRIDGNEESPPWRLIGAVDGTMLTWEPAAPPGAPAMIGLGQVAEFNAPGPFIVRSQDKDHPFYFAGYMTGGLAYQGRGDPEWVNVIPPAQYLDKYVFFTDPTYPETELVVVRNRVDGAFADVTLGCAGALGGWQPIGANQEWTRIDLVTGNFTDIGACSNGRHEMSSTNPFGVTVWGWGSMATGQNPFSQHVSYAYPGGAAIRAINEVVVQPQ